MNTSDLPIWNLGKVLFNHKEHKVGTKGTKLKHYNINLCDLCENSL
jgi:hypothetical protein